MAMWSAHEPLSFAVCVSECQCVSVYVSVVAVGGFAVVLERAHVNG